MSISEADIKKLWGLAAGRCSRPGCPEVCVKFLSDSPTVIGEMAHVVDKRPGGRRSTTIGGEDSYENLILLCPTHHTEVDKAPRDTFPPALLFEWKQRHEASVSAALSSPTFKSLGAVSAYILTQLIENRAAWEAYGPESAEAGTNPLSSLAQVWALRKLGTIVPNNRRIIDAIRRNRQLFDTKTYELACAFIEHAEGFEHSCYERTEGVPRFPKAFAAKVKAHAKAQ